MTDYKERMTNAKEYLYKRLKAPSLTVKDAEKSAEKFYEYNPKEFIEKPLEHFIHCMESVDRTIIVYERKAFWCEIGRNKYYNAAFEAKLFSLIKSGLEKVSPDFCKYTVFTDTKINFNIRSVEEKYLVIIMRIKE